MFIQDFKTAITMQMEVPKKRNSYRKDGTKRKNAKDTLYRY